MASVPLSALALLLDVGQLWALALLLGVGQLWALALLLDVGQLWALALLLDVGQLWASGWWPLPLPLCFGLAPVPYRGTPLCRVGPSSGPGTVGCGWGPRICSEPFGCPATAPT